MAELGERVEQDRVQSTPSQAPKAPGKTTVAVIGGGIAGLTAALRLAERGYKVTVYEQKAHLGGNFDAHRHPHPSRKGTRHENTFHEHSFHMLLHWYHNFFALATDIGLDRYRDFEPRTSFKHLRPGEFPNLISLRSPGSASGLLSNLVSGLQPIPDMFLYSYSLIDLIGQPINPNRLLDRYSVTGFMQSRAYASEGSTALHENTLARAFASPSYLSSAASYQSFIGYSFRNPEPMLWVLKGDAQHAFHQKLEERLKSYGVKIRLSRRVTKIETRTPPPEVLPGAPGWSGDKVADAGDDGRVKEIEHTQIGPNDRSVVDCFLFSVNESADRDSPPASIFEAGRRQGPPEGPSPDTDSPDYVVLAVPPNQVAPLLLPPVVDKLTQVQRLSEAHLEIAQIPRLRGAPMASLDLRFNKKLDGIPKEHVALVGSRFDLSFVDNSQIWPDVDTTLLNVVASSASEIGQLSAGEAVYLIVMELTRFLHFDPTKDIDWELCHYQPNLGDALFLNDVGSEQWRPPAKTRFPNLFLAGDYCRTFIDVVTLEGAVVSGLEAARELQAQAIADGSFSAADPRTRPIPIIVPETAPMENIYLLKLLLAPWAAAAKWWSWTDEQVRDVQRGDFSGTQAAYDLAAMGTALVQLPYRVTAEVWRAGLAALFGPGPDGDGD